MRQTKHTMCAFTIHIRNMNGIFTMPAYTRLTKQIQSKCYKTVGGSSNAHEYFSLSRCLSLSISFDVCACVSLSAVVYGVCDAFRVPRHTRSLELIRWECYVSGMCVCVCLCLNTVWCSVQRMRRFENPNAKKMEEWKNERSSYRTHSSEWTERWVAAWRRTVVVRERS